MDNLTTRGMSPDSLAGVTGDIPATPLKTILANAICDGVESITGAGRVYDLRPHVAEALRTVESSHSQPWHEGDYCVACGSRTPNGGCLWASACELADTIIEEGH